MHEHARVPGFALVSCLLFAVIVALLTLATQAAVQVETRIAYNAELRERAFAAAEWGIAQALATTALKPSYTLSQPWRFPATAGAFEPVREQDGDGFRYSVYLVGTRGLISDTADEAGLEFHFVVESVGRAAGGAQDSHVQGFHVRRAADWTGDTTASCAFDCTSGSHASCSSSCGADGIDVVRTYWRQLQAE